MNLRTWHLADGRRLMWRETGRGPTMVLLHGWSLTGAAFNELAAWLEGYRLLLPDLPGHGGSSPANVVTLASFADDLSEWLSFVAPGPLVLGGWSLGGMVALEMAARPLDVVRRLLLIGTTPRFTATTDWCHGLPVGQVLALRRNLKQSFAKTLGTFFDLTFAPGEVNEAGKSHIKQFAVDTGPGPDPDCTARLLTLLTEQDQRTLLAAVHCPSLVLHGSADQVTPIGAGRALATALPAGVLCEFAGAGHAPFWTQPQAAARAIMEFCLWDR